MTSSGHLPTVVEVEPATEADFAWAPDEGRRGSSSESYNHLSPNKSSSSIGSLQESENEAAAGEGTLPSSGSSSRSNSLRAAIDVPKVIITPRMSPSHNVSPDNNNDDGLKEESPSVSIIDIECPSPKLQVSFNGVSRLSPGGPLLAGRQSYSAPPSPTAGSKQTTQQSQYTFNNTLTNIDSKVRKWIGSKYGRFRRRVIFKNGDVNLTQTNVSKRRRRYLKDLFTTLVDIQWRFTLLIFSMSFILSWLFFSIVWWAIAFVHGDTLDSNLNKMTLSPPEFKPCVNNVYGFTSAFLFSVETQHTIGYGSRYTNDECPFAVLIMCIQSIVGVLIQAVMVGIIFAKMSRPKKRTQTLVFSRNAVICQRDGQLCLIFRVGDMRKSHIISANVRAQIIKQRVTKEGEVLPFYQHELPVDVDEQDQIFFIWPVMVVHKIDEKSPLYGLSKEDLKTERFEVVVILEGVIETTGATTQARSSYLPTELLWGHRFETMVSFKKEIGEYAVDHTLFNHTYEVETPPYSARELHDLRQMQDRMVRQGSISLMAQFQPPINRPR